MVHKSKSTPNFGRASDFCAPISVNPFQIDLNYLTMYKGIHIPQEARKQLDSNYSRRARSLAGRLSKEGSSFFAGAKLALSI